MVRKGWLSSKNLILIILLLATIITAVGVIGQQTNFFSRASQSSVTRYNINPSPQFGSSPLTVIFTTLGPDRREGAPQLPPSSDNTNWESQWDFGDSSTSVYPFGALVSHTYNNTDLNTTKTFTVTVTIRNKSLGGKIVGTANNLVSVKPALATSCVRQNPTIVINPATQTGAPGQTLYYTLLLTNNDSAGCQRSTFGLNFAGVGANQGGQRSVWPAGFTHNNYSMATAVNPGQTQKVRLDVTSPTSATMGTYTFLEAYTNLSVKTLDGTKIYYPFGGVGSGSYVVGSTIPWQRR